MTVGQPRQPTAKERRQAEKDDAAMDVDLERATRDTIDAHSPSEPPRVATDYVHTTHPETGIDVVFVPGETLPAWAPEN